METPLKAIPFFSEMSEEDLEKLARTIQKVSLDEGEMLFEDGSPGDRAYVVEDGQLEVIKMKEGQEVLLGLVDKGSVIGEMALLDKAPRMASARARVPTTLFAISQQQLDDLLNSSSSAVRAMLATITKRWHETGGQLVQSEKMAQLGTMTAGMSHELNNPASALQRGAEQVKKTFAELQQAHFQISSLMPTPEQLEAMKQWDARAREAARQRASIDALTQSDREEQFEAWLEKNGLRDGWMFTPDLVSLGLQTSDLETIKAQFTPELFPQILMWLSRSYNLYSSLLEFGGGAKHITQVVKALKTYSFQDDQTLRMVELNRNIEEAANLLEGKRGAGIEVKFELAEGLLVVMGSASELIQVWANILLNAIEALNGKGEILVRTYKEDDCAVVEISNNGPVIPPEIQSRVFDPFFTTKPVGQGSGLGLNICYNIVTRKHGGEITLDSRPGKTTFTVKLPGSSRG